MSGFMVGAGRVGYQESGNTPEIVCGKRGRARSALFWRVYLKNVIFFKLRSILKRIISSLMYLHIVLFVSREHECLAGLHEA